MQLLFALCKIRELTVGHDKLLERDGEVLEDPLLKEQLMKLAVEKISTYVKEIEAQVQVIGSLKVIVIDTSAFVKLCTDSKRLVLLQFVVDSILKAKALTEFSARVDAANTILKAYSFQQCMNESLNGKINFRPCRQIRHCHKSSRRRSKT